MQKNDYRKFQASHVRTQKMGSETYELNQTDKNRITHFLDQRSLVIIGMPGVGKSTVGRKIAHYLAYPFVDSDIEIEKAANKKISEIFEDEGEAFFRQKEQQVIERLLQCQQCVVSLGGGACMEQKTRDNLKTMAYVFWLHAPLEILYENIRKNHDRPLLKNKQPEKILKRLLLERQTHYDEVANHMIFYEKRHSKDENAQNMISILQQECLHHDNANQHER